MKLCKTEELLENNVIARAVMNSEYQILLAEGTVLKTDYIEKLKEFGIEEVYIKDTKIPDAESIVILKEETEKNLKEKVKSILERHMYHHNQELVELSNTADHIISNIMDKDALIEQVFDIKERSADIYEHSLTICTLAIIVGIKMKLSIDSVHDIGVGCLLHDIGLRYLTINYTNQKISDLKDYEKLEYKKHPVYGYTALKDETWISERSKNIILYHHEKLDGSGFPLKATNIPIESEIVGVCDIFDEMICGIGYNRIKVYEAIEYLKLVKGKQYKEEIVDNFLSITAVYPVGSLVKTNDGQTAIVLKQNNQYPEKPVIKVIKNADGSIIEEEIVLDLVKMNHIFIDKVIN